MICRLIFIKMQRNSIFSITEGFWGTGTAQVLHTLQPSTLSYWVHIHANMKWKSCGIAWRQLYGYKRCIIWHSVWHGLFSLRLPADVCRLTSDNIRKHNMYHKYIVKCSVPHQFFCYERIQRRTNELKCFFTVFLLD